MKIKYSSKGHDGSDVFIQFTPDDIFGFLVGHNNILMSSRKGNLEFYRHHEWKEAVVETGKKVAEIHYDGCIEVYKHRNNSYYVDINRQYFYFYGHISKRFMRPYRKDGYGYIENFLHESGYEYLGYLRMFRDE